LSLERAKEVLMSYTKLMYHIVFSTKARRRSICQDASTRICQYVGGIIRQEGGSMLEANAPEDHMHIVTIAKPTHAPCDLIGRIKANSSKWIHRSLAGMADFGWQDGYSAFSVAPSTLAKTLAYVRNQWEHHRDMSFQEELIELLKRHGVDCDERYVFA